MSQARRCLEWAFKWIQRSSPRITQCHRKLCLHRSLPCSLSPSKPAPSLTQSLPSKTKTLSKIRQRRANILLSDWLRDISILSGSFSWALSLAHKPMLCFSLRGQRRRSRGSQKHRQCRKTDAGNHKLSKQVCSRWRFWPLIDVVAPSTRAPSPRSGASDTDTPRGCCNLHGVLADTWKTNINQHLVMNYGWRWNACSRPCLSTGDVIYSLIEICFPSWLGGIYYIACMVLYAVYSYWLFWSHKIHQLRRYVLGEHLNIYEKLDYGLIYLFPLI